MGCCIELTSDHYVTFMFACKGKLSSYCKHPAPRATQIRTRFTRIGFDELISCTPAVRSGLRAVAAYCDNDPTRCLPGCGCIARVNFRYLII